MIPVSFRDCEERLLKHLKGPNLRRFIRAVCKIGFSLPKDMDEWTTQSIGHSDFLAIILADWLTRLRVLFNEAQVQDIVSRAPLDAWNTQIREDENKQGPLTVFILDVVEGRWIVYTGRTGFYDAVEGSTIDELPYPAVTHIFCDVTALYNRSRRILEGGKDVPDDTESGFCDTLEHGQPPQ